MFLGTGRADEAAVILQQLIDRDPNNGEALMSLASYHSGKSAYEKAAFLYERAIKIDEYEKEALLAYAEMRVAQKEYAKAIPLLRRYLRIERNSSVERYLESIERVAAQIAARNAS